MSDPSAEPSAEPDGLEPLDAGPPPPLWLSYLQLFRAPNVFSAAADVTAGFVFVHGSLAPAATFATLVAASLCLYVAGMVLNDVYDLEIDRVERPERPLPSGRIPVAWARMLGFLLLGGGVALAWLAGYVTAGQTALPWRSGAVATVLAGCILLYDAWAKQTWFGPIVMGLCRMFNLLLGMSAASQLPHDESVLLVGFAADHLLVAGGMGLYIAGVTLFARDEVSESSPLTLGAGTVTMIIGIVLVGLSVLFLSGPTRTALALEAGRGLWWMLLGALCLTNVLRCVLGIVHSTPEAIQLAVKQSLMSIILYDAAIALVNGESPYYGLGVVALLAPAWFLGRWVYST